MKRFRRLRTTETIRTLVRETHIQKENLIYPLFVIEGENVKNPVPSMPEIYQYSVDRSVKAEFQVFCFSEFPKPKMNMLRPPMTLTVLPRRQ